MPRGLVSGRGRKPGASSVIIKNRAAPNLRPPPQMKRFLFKNDYAVVAMVVASFLNDFGVLYDVRVPVVFSKGKPQTAVVASGDRRLLVCVFLRKT